MNNPENNNPTPTPVDNTADFIAKIEEIKKNTVPLDVYNKLKEDNKMLIDTISQQEIQQPVEEPAPQMTEEEFKKYLDIASSTSINIPSHKRMEAITKVRNYTLEREGIDIFADPTDGEGCPPTEESTLFAEGIEYVLERSNDGPKFNRENRFNTELAGITRGK